MSPAAVLCGLGGWVPPTVVTNAMLAEQLDTSDDWIRSRTGIGSRHVIEVGMSTATMAVEAGRRALACAAVDSVDMVVVATSTPDRSCPGTAPTVAHALGLGDVPAFDVAAVCSGFLYALAIGSGLVVSGSHPTTLVIAADAFSTILDPTDRSTRAIFGDGAGAAVLTRGEDTDPGALLGFELGSDGSGRDLITVPAGGSEQRASDEPAAESDFYFTMEGKAVFSRAVRQIGDSAQALAEQIGWTLSEVDLFVAHQANRRILRSCAERLGLDDSQVFVHLEKVGNTAAASVPLALADAAADGELEAGDRVLLSAFGGGLTWGAAALRWPDIAVEPCL